MLQGLMQAGDPAPAFAGSGDPESSRLLHCSLLVTMFAPTPTRSPEDSLKFMLMFTADWDTRMRSEEGMRTREDDSKVECG